MSTYCCSPESHTSHSGGPNVYSQIIRQTIIIAISVACDISVCFKLLYLFPFVTYAIIINGMGVFLFRIYSFATLHVPLIHWIDHGYWSIWDVIPGQWHEFLSICYLHAGIWCVLFSRWYEHQTRARDQGDSSLSLDARRNFEIFQIVILKLSKS